MPATAKSHTWRGYTWEQLRRCAERELKRRRQKYPNLVLTHRMDREESEMEYDMMRVIVAHLAELADGERLL